MNYSAAEVIQFVQEEDVKFIRLAFCDVFGTQKNISIMAGELPRAFQYGIAMDAWSIAGFDSDTRSDLFLHPDPATLCILPWRPENGRVVRMFCNITYPDGTPFECDTRHLLKQAVEKAREAGCSFRFGSEMEFYLFKRDDQGEPTKIPYDRAGYMDIAPDDKGENVRREICLTLEQMGIYPESSHHEEGPGQNEIDFRYADPLTAADHAVTFRSVVKTIANRNGVCADFSPKPLAGFPGNGFHVNFSVRETGGRELLPQVIAGLMEKVEDMTLFLNPTAASYQRLGSSKAPGYITWSRENRSQLIRIPAAQGEFRRGELRSPDPAANPYIAFALIIYAGLYGIENHLQPPEAADLNLYIASAETLKQFKHLPNTLDKAARAAKASAFIAEHLPEAILSAYCR